MGETLTAQHLYEMFKTAKGPEAISAAQAAAYQLAGSYQERAMSAQKLIDGITSGWQGDAAGAASQGMAPFAENALRTGDELNSTQDLVYRQVHSYHAAANAMRPVPPEPQMQNVITTVMSGQQPQSMLTQIANYSAATNANTDAYATYVSSSQFNVTNLPDLSTPMSSQSAPVSVAPPQQQPVAVRHLTFAPPVSTGSSASTQTHGGATPNSSGSTPPRTVSGNGAGPQTGASAPDGGSQTTISNAAPPTTSITPNVGSANPTAGSALPPSVPAGGGALGGGWLAGGGQPGGSGGGGLLPGAGNGSVGARLDSGDGAVGGGLPSGGGSQGQGSRSGAGANAGAVTEENVAEQGLSGGRGATGGSAGGVGAGRTGKGDADAEHKRRYDYEEDPKLFQNTTKVAPQVIGESAAEHEARIAREMG